MPVRACFVQVCPNTSENSPSKLFLSVPQNNTLRQLWWNIANGSSNKKLKLNSPDMVCCEDHFDLENDCKNWMYFKMMGGTIKFKPNAQPSRYIREPPKTPLPSVLTDSMRWQQTQNFRNEAIERFTKKFHKVTSKDIIAVTITEEPTIQDSLDEDVVYVPPPAEAVPTTISTNRENVSLKRSAQDENPSTSKNLDSAKKPKHEVVPATVDKNDKELSFDILVKMYSEFIKIPVPQCKCTAKSMKRRVQPKKKLTQIPAVIELE